MIVKYRSHKCNWSYIESERFAIAYLHMPPIPEKVCATQEESLMELDAAYVERKRFIEEQTGAPAVLVEFLTQGDIRSLDRCTVVMPSPMDAAWVINTEAYLMTDTGKTIERIA